MIVERPIEFGADPGGGGVKSTVDMHVAPQSRNPDSEKT